MAGGLCVCHLWGGYDKQGQVILVKTGGRKGMHAVGGGQRWPTGAQSTLQGECPAPTDKCGCAWGLQGQTGTPCSPTWGMRTFSWEWQRASNPTAWLLLAPCRQHTSCSTRKVGAPLPLPCQGSSDQPSQEHAAANTPLFTKYSRIMALTLHQGSQRILVNAKGICSPLSLSAHGMEGPLLLCPCCRGRAIPPASLHGAYWGMQLVDLGTPVLRSPMQELRQGLVFFTKWLLRTFSCVLGLAFQGREVQNQSNVCE